MKHDAIIIKAQDNVATALRNLTKGDECRIAIGKEVREIMIQDSIVYGHKFAVVDIPKGVNIIKYGEVMGRATADIPKGAHAHIQNIESLRGRGDLKRKGD